MSIEEILKGVTGAGPFLNIKTIKSNNNNKDYYIKIIKIKIILFQNEILSFQIKLEIKFHELEKDQFKEHLYYNIWLNYPNIMNTNDITKTLLIILLLTKLMPAKL